MNTGDRIRSLRTSKGLTLEDVAKAAGTIKQTIYKYEHGVVENIPQDRINAIAAVLGTTPEYLLCLTDDPYPMDPRLIEVFRKRLAAEILLHDSANLEAEFGTPKPYENVLEGTVPLTLGLAYTIADKMCVSLDYLLGFTDSPHAHILSIPHRRELPELDGFEEKLEEAEEELLAVVRRICGMSYFSISKDVASGRFTQIWNPEKIKKVMEFLLKNEESLSLMVDVIEKKKETPSEDNDWLSDI